MDHICYYSGMHCFIVMHMCITLNIALVMARNACHSLLLLCLTEFKSQLKNPRLFILGQNDKNVTSNR